MSNYYLAQIVGFGGNFAPRSWALCHGQLMSIAQNTALFSLLGTTYGGNGQTTFALPDLRGRRNVGHGQGPGLSPVALGQQDGTESSTMTVATMPAHSHTAGFNGTASSLNASTAKSTTQIPASGTPLGKSVDNSGNVQPRIYAPAGSPTAVPLAGLNVAGTVALGATGGSVPFAIREPYLAITQIIAVQGVYPARN